MVLLVLLVVLLLLRLLLQSWWVIAIEPELGPERLLLLLGPRFLLLMLLGLLAIALPLACAWVVKHCLLLLQSWWVIAIEPGQVLAAA